METIAEGLAACRNHGVKEAMITIWTNDNAECDLFANLFGLSYFAELAFDRDANEEKRRARFEACTGGDFTAFYEMSFYHNKFDAALLEDKYSNRFLGKPLFWQDILEGLYDTHLFERPMSGHYAACAERMYKTAASRTEDRWQYLYDFAARVFDYLAVKCGVAERMQPAYLAGDREVLTDILQKKLPLLKERCAPSTRHTAQCGSPTARSSAGAIWTFAMPALPHAAKPPRSYCRSIWMASSPLSTALTRCACPKS
jgi:hypothetical protein